MPPRVPAEEKPGEEEDRDDEHDACDDAYPRQDSGQATTLV
ncbi:hypothetical protein [Mycolicibacterium aromaticivorans]|nr:hypothetical protein [Mycolicibacterium aromaticivorans]